MQNIALESLVACAQLVLWSFAFTFRFYRIWGKFGQAASSKRPRYSFPKGNFFFFIMNELCIYIALYCVLLYTQSALQSYGGVSPQPPPVCSIHLDDATAATGQRRQCAHHTPATGGEEKESLSQSSGWGLLGGHDWQGPVVGIWPGHRGYTPTLYEKCHGIFNDHRESGPQFNVSSERRCFLTL